jgi:hypothetical protein
MCRILGPNPAHSLIEEIETVIGGIDCVGPYRPRPRKDAATPAIRSRLRPFDSAGANRLLEDEDDDEDD